MKIYFISFVLLLLVGCRTSSIIDYSKLNYGIKQQQVQLIVKKPLNPIFEFIDKNKKIYQCQSFYDRTHYKTYYLLFEDEKLISLLQNNNYAPPEIKNFYKPDEVLPLNKDFILLKAPFLPSTSINKIDFDKIDFLKKDENRKHNIRMSVSFFSFWPISVPIFTVVMPVVIYYGLAGHDSEVELPLGISYEQVIKKLGKPTSTHGNPDKYGIIKYNFKPISSYGFKDRNLIWKIDDRIYNSKKNRLRNNLHNSLYSSTFLHDHKFDSIPKNLADDGYFVIIPTSLGGSIGILAGHPIGIALLLVYSPITIVELISSYKIIDFPYNIGCMTCDIAYRSCQYILGLPFWATKKVIWDYPKYGIESMFGIETQSSKTEAQLIGKWQEKGNSQTFFQFRPDHTMTSQIKKDTDIETKRGSYSVREDKVFCYFEILEMTFVLNRDTLICLEPLFATPMELQKIKTKQMHTDILNSTDTR